MFQQLFVMIIRFTIGFLEGQSDCIARLKCCRVYVVKILTDLHAHNVCDSCLMTPIYYVNSELPKHPLLICIAQEKQLSLLVIIFIVLLIFIGAAD